MKHRTVIALDLAKHIIQVAKIDTHGSFIFNKPMSPPKVRSLLANTAPSIVAMEGCGSAHYWGRLAQQYGHEVRMMAPKNVAPYVSAQKTDANDALGIAVASQQLNMPLCPIKNEQQQTIQSLLASRQLLKKSQTSTSNHIRGLCYEFGLTMNKGQPHLAHFMARLLDEANDQLPPALKSVLRVMWEQYQHTVKQLGVITQQLTDWVKAYDPCKRLMQLEGIGPISAAGIYANLGDGSGFKNGRNASVYLGLTPKQHSSGGKVVMRGIDRYAGDRSLRAAMFQGALAVIRQLPERPKTTKQQWLIELIQRVGMKRACIALMNKNIRTAWALLNTGQAYQVKTL